MLDTLFNSPILFLFWIGSVVLAITVHEFAHAFVADQLGDPTPRLQDRLTLNPRAHLDPWGTILLVLAGFGWGKPVEFDPYNLRHPRRDAALISIAGPASNILLALLCTGLWHILTSNAAIILHDTVLSSTIVLIARFLLQSIVMNVSLAIFNLVPVHPLDGFKIVGGLLSPTQAREWFSLERFGPIFLILLIVPLFGSHSLVSQFISPIISGIVRLLIPQTI
jgi:Zn-dependent protease